MDVVIIVEPKNFDKRWQKGQQRESKIEIPTIQFAPTENNTMMLILHRCLSFKVKQLL